MTSYLLDVTIFLYISLFSFFHTIRTNCYTSGWGIKIDGMATRIYVMCPFVSSEILFTYRAGQPKITMKKSIKLVINSEYLFLDISYLD